MVTCCDILAANPVTGALTLRERQDSLRMHSKVAASAGLDRIPCRCPSSVAPMQPWLLNGSTWALLIDGCASLFYSNAVFVYSPSFRGGVKAFLPPQFTAPLHLRYNFHKFSNQLVTMLAPLSAVACLTRYGTNAAPSIGGKRAGIGASACPLARMGAKIA